MEAIDLKIQEAIESIQVHGRRIKNLVKNDPINNKVDENWKMSLQAKDMLKQDKKGASKANNETKKNTSVRSIPLQKNPELNAPPNRTIQISCLDPRKPSGIQAKATIVDGRYEQTDGSGRIIDYCSLSVFKIYFRFKYKFVNKLYI